MKKRKKEKKKKITMRSLITSRLVQTLSHTRTHHLPRQQVTQLLPDDTLSLCVYKYIYIYIYIFNFNLNFCINKKIRTLTRTPLQGWWHMPTVTSLLPL